MDEIITNVSQDHWDTDISWTLGQNRRFGTLAISIEDVSVASGVSVPSGPMLIRC